MRTLIRSDLPAAAALHEIVLREEFIARGGRPFLRAYYLGWITSGSDLSLAAVDSAGDLVGVLLGSVDPATHYRRMLRTVGWRLALHLTLHALSHPSFARELVVTRSRRYAGGALRAARGALQRHPAGGPSPAPPERGGEVTHVLVRPDRQGTGVGRSLLSAAAAEARTAGLSSLTLVTPPELADSGFYDRLGWRRGGSAISRSGEGFVTYELDLDG